MPALRQEACRCAQQTLVRHCAVVLFIGVLTVLTVFRSTETVSSLRKGNRRLDTDLIRTGWPKSGICPCGPDSPCRDYDALTCHAKTNVNGLADCTAHDLGTWTLELTIQRWKEKASGALPCYCPVKTTDLSNLCSNVNDVKIWWADFISQSSFGNNETLADILNQYVGALTLGGSKTPTPASTLAPTAPTTAPTAGPPTDQPTAVPTKIPTLVPTATPTAAPTPQLLESCPWLQPIPHNFAPDRLTMQCVDGATHSIRTNVSFCNGHGGRAACPLDLPTMCADRTCEGDHCCSSVMCRDHGGPRSCTAEVGRTYSSAGRGYCRGDGDTRAEQSTVFIGISLFNCRLSCSGFPRCLGFAHAALPAKCVLYYTGNSTDTHPAGHWIIQPEPPTGSSSAVLRGTTISQGTSFVGADHDCFIVESR
jgi:hypothetical protein